MSRAAVPAMLANGGGSLLHVSRDSARLPEIGNLDYAAANLPLLALSTSLATEFSPQGIRSNRRRMERRRRRPPSDLTRTKTWLITGSSRGFGWELTKAALDRGDRVSPPPAARSSWTTSCSSTATAFGPSHSM